MKGILFTVAVSLLILLGMTILQSDAQTIGQTNMPAWGKAVVGLQCRVVTERNEYTIGEPIVVEFQLRNCADRSVFVYQGYHTLVTTSFDIRGSKGERVGYRGYVSGVGLCYPSLLPGTNEHCDRTGYYMCGKSFDLSREYEILSPGTYTVTAIFRGRESAISHPKCETTETPVWTGKLSSNTIEIKVSPKEDPK